MVVKVDNVIAYKGMLKDFAKEIFTASRQANLIQCVPMRVGDMKRGCLIRFHLNTGF